MKLSYGEGAALVAGGSGGIGAAVVKSLAGAGVPVAFTYRTGKQAADALIEGHAGPAPIKAYPWSSSAAEAAKDLLARVHEDFGVPRFLVAATGVAQDAALHTLAEQDWQRVIDTNLSAVVALTHAAALPMMKVGGGRIVLIGSVSGLRGIKGHTIYAATKAALGGLTRALAREAGGFEVTVNCVAPGFIETPMLDGMPEVARKKWIRRIPLGRFGEPPEVASLVGFLLSEQAAYVTGQTYVIDGGISL